MNTLSLAQRLELAKLATDLARDEYQRLTGEFRLIAMSNRRGDSTITAVG